MTEDQPIEGGRRSRAWGFARAVALAAAVTACGKSNAQLNIASVGDTMAYDQTSLTVKTGQHVRLTLTNRGTSPAMKHNWVLVKPNTESAVATRGLAAGEGAGYVQAGDADVLAHTALSQPGGTVSVEFTAPAPGSYPYICTFPGHWMTMRGTLTVTQ